MRKLTWRLGSTKNPQNGGEFSKGNRKWDPLFEGKEVGETL